MKRVIALLLVCIGVALPYLKSMEVVPTRADWSGWTVRDGWVGNTFTANFDSAAEVQFFVGHVGDTSHHYNVDIYDWPNVSNPIAYSYNVAAPARGHVWLKFDLETQSGQKFVWGNEYLLKVTRPNAGLDSEHSQSTIS